jgi:large subunit ribosomal protein L17
MYKRNSIKKLGKTSSHRKALIQNQLRSILANGKVKTSSVKAKVLRGELESLLNSVKLGKEGDLSLTKKLYRVFGKSELVKKIMEVGKKDDVKVSVKKVGFRIGDNTEMSLVEISGFKNKEKSKKKAETEVGKKEEEVVETKKSEEIKKGILNLGTKTLSKKVEPIKKERARTRSGL